ncbi:helix-turn-helix domain-containing protein [Amycolatopsis lurida]
MAGSVNQDPDFDLAHRQALGARLKALRLSRGMTVDEFRDELHANICNGTVHAYESGERRMTVQRLCDFCDVLGTRAHELLAQVDRDLESTSTFWVRSSLLTDTSDPELGPLRAWARARQIDGRTPRGARHQIEFDPATLRSAAQLCGLNPEQLASRLRGMGLPGSDAAEAS